MIHSILQQQVDYYRARAGEYDDWFYRRGRYDRGNELNERWFTEVAVVKQSLAQIGACDSVLELACGTGLWTGELLKVARQVTAIDASEEMIEINRRRCRSPRVEYQQRDLFSWEPDREFDLVAVAFWLSHVPPDLLDAFLDKVRRSVRAGGRLFLVDSLFEASSTARDHVLRDQEQNWQLRKLDDGREFRVVKVFYEPAELQERLARFGFAAVLHKSGCYFLYGSGTRR